MGIRAGARDTTLAKSSGELSLIRLIGHLDCLILVMHRSEVPLPAVAENIYPRIYVYVNHLRVENLQ